jgi:hypothetical protein
MTTTTKRTKRIAPLPKSEPMYLWVPVALLEENDSIVVLQQEARVLKGALKGDIWVLNIWNQETRAKSEEYYRSGQFIYTKSSESVKKRLEQWQQTGKGEGQ